MKTWNVEKLAANLHDKTEFVIHMRNLEQAINYELVLKKVLRVIILNQTTWLKPYIDLRKTTKKYFEKDFYKLMSNAVFGKTNENLRKQNFSLHT